MVWVNVQELVTGVAVAIVVQIGWDRSRVVCSVRRKYGVVLRTTVAELGAFLEILVNRGAASVGRLPLVPLKVTPAVNAKALPSIVLLVFSVMA